MTSFLIARLPSHSKSLAAVEFMQRNAFSYHISSNAPLLNLLMSSGGVEGHLQTVLLQSEEIELGKEEKHIIDQLTNPFDMKKEIKEEVDEKPVQTKKSIENLSLSHIKEFLMSIFDAGLSDHSQIAVAPPAESEEVPHESAMEPVYDNDILQTLECLLNQVTNEQFLLPDGAVVDDLHVPFESDFINFSMDSGIVQSFDNMEFGIDKNLRSLADDADQLRHNNDAPGVAPQIEENHDEREVSPGEDITGEPMEDDCWDNDAHNTSLLCEFGDDFLDTLEFDEPSIGYENWAIEKEEEEKNKDSGNGDEGREVNVYENGEESKESEGDKENGDGEEENDHDNDVEKEEESSEGKEEYEGNDDEEEQENVKATRKPRTKRNNRPSFACPFKNCSSSFRTVFRLKQHIKQHSATDKSTCDVCKKEFSSVREALEHLQTKKDKKCCACDKSYTTKQGLLLHHRLHTQEMPFGCEECGERFSFHYLLKIHETEHSGVKQFSCRDCGKEFTLKHHLKNHKVVHTKEKRFPCSQCDLAFSFRFSLRTHERTHSDEKPFECEQCGGRFRRKDGLQQHVRKLHGENLVLKGNSARKSKDCRP